MSTDRLILQPTTGRQINLPWSGTWPPPERLYVVESAGIPGPGQTGAGLVLVDPNTQSEDTLAQLVLDHGAVLYVQASASEIPEPARDDEHWFRGAVYVPWNDRER